ncbi:hypothetical protein [Glycomyces paridis]|uniref:Uncharacterized protein n=1 Tax=Glycomyces paridis TaxID=2126555 RepID=A0A4S8NVI3_9ACTN|nr:hypothetical protein [Glycomyces paridis]THV21673.1 hypothetical protein E9998_24635 [Glycomyces paridis]
MSFLNPLNWVRTVVEWIRLDAFIGWVHETAVSSTWLPAAALLWLPIAWLLVFATARFLVRRVVPKSGPVVYGVGMGVVGLIGMAALALDALLATCLVKLGRRPWYGLGDRAADAGVGCDAGLRRFTAEKLPAAKGAKWRAPAVVTLLLLIGWWGGDGCGSGAGTACAGSGQVWWNDTSTLVADDWVPAVTEFFAEAGSA